ncbi:TonB-dependent receptor [Neiella marina]|uniref:TonB-dependent receptor n=1 Tax=Neiella holothuriorum TaxID=2870530 RepID=A0ABS7ED18_9GAMM|nr:TonB-dependent receptor [Neiella holothuriorum]MBW8190130.1 TonB-dependent receptor [Neiella holothuriorum]
MSQVRRALFFLVLGHSTAVYAADKADNIEVITVEGSRHLVLQQQSGVHEISLSDDVLSQIKHQHIQQSLNRLPGVNLARGNGQEYLPSVRSPVLTGAGACGSILSAIDGISIRAAGFCNINELFEAPTELAERIDVIRGPDSVLYGANAMNGVINVVTPALDSEPSQSARLEYGADDFKRAVYSANGGAEAPIRFDALIASDGGYRDSSGYDQQKFNVKHQSQIDGWDYIATVSGTNLEQDTAGYITGYKAYESKSLSKTNPNPDAYRDAQSLRAAMHFTKLDENDGQWSLIPYARYTDMEFLQHFLPGTPVEQNRHHSLGIQSAYLAQIGDSIEWTAGIDGEWTDGELKQTQAEPTEGSEFLQETIPVGKQYDYQVDALQLASFANVSWQATELLTLAVGARLEYMEYDYNNRMLDGRTREDGTECGFGGCRYSRPADDTNSFTNFSPKFSAVYEVSELSQVYFNLSHSFRPPQATELYRLQREQTVADLDSEEQLSTQLGYRLTTSQLAAEVVGYWADKENVIYRDSDYFNVSDGEVRSQGAEVLLHYIFNSRWDIRGVANYGRHRYRNHRIINGVEIYNNDVDSAPRHFGNLQLGYQLGEQGRIELEYQYQGSYYTDAENLHKYNGHELFNLYSSLNWQGITLSLNMFNLFDERYAERADYTSFSGDRYFPSRPRSVFAAIEFSL